MEILGQLKNMANRIIGEVIKYIRQNRRKTLIFLIMTAGLSVGVISIFYNYNWYDATIVRIDTASNAFTHEKEGSRGVEKYYTQTLSGTVMNGEHQGGRVHLRNQYSSSGVYDDSITPAMKCLSKSVQTAMRCWKEPLRVSNVINTLLS